MNVFKNVKINKAPKMERSVSMLKNFLFGSSNTKTEYVVWKFPGLLVVAVQNIAELPDFSSYPLPFT